MRGAGAFGVASAVAFVAAVLAGEPALGLLAHPSGVTVMAGTREPRSRLVGHRPTLMPVRERHQPLPDGEARRDLSCPSLGVPALFAHVFAACARTGAAAPCRHQTREQPGRELALLVWMDEVVVVEPAVWTPSWAAGQATAIRPWPQ